MQSPPVNHRLKLAAQKPFAGNIIKEEGELFLKLGIRIEKTDHRAAVTESCVLLDFIGLKVQRKKLKRGGACHGFKCELFPASIIFQVGTAGLISKGEG